MMTAKTTLRRKLRAAFALRMAYDPDEPRDKDGKWTDSGGGVPDSEGNVIKDEPPAGYDPNSPPPLSDEAKDGKPDKPDKPKEKKEKKPKVYPGRAADDKEWKAKMSGKERQAVDVWVGGGQKAIRQAIASGKLTDSPHAEHFLSAMDKAPVYRGNLYRGMHFHDPETPGAKEIITKFSQVGNIVSLETHSGFSKNKSVARDFAGGLGSKKGADSTPIKALLFRTNGKAYDMHGMALSSEKEVIVPKGTKFKITKTIKKGPLLEVIMRQVRESVKLAFPTRTTLASRLRSRAAQVAVVQEIVAAFDPHIAPTDLKPSRTLNDVLPQIVGDKIDNPLYTSRSEGAFTEMRRHLPGAYGALTKLSNAARNELVPIDKIVSPQKNAVASKVQKFMEMLAKQGRLDLSEVRVVKFHGQYFLEDGNHRLSAMKLMGVRYVRVPVEDLDKYLSTGGAKGPLQLSQGVEE